MKQIGVYLLIFGIGSIVLNLIGLEFKLLMWIDLWGTATGWAIRLGMIVVGGLIVAFAPASHHE